MTVKKGKELLNEPPRLLLGVAFLFWGAMQDHPFAALLAAVLVEARHWTGLRWDFGITGFVRAWQISMLVLIVTTVGLLRSTEVTAVEFLNLMAWLPFMMMPLALAQQYSLNGGAPAVAFSFIARRKMASDRKHGRPVEVSTIHLGYPYFVLILITGGMGVGRMGYWGGSQIQYGIGVAVLLGWAFFKVGRRRRRPLAWGCAFLVSIVLATTMLWGLDYVYQKYLKRYSGEHSQRVSPTESHTSLNQIGELQLSPKILWRYFHERGERPQLLRMAAYNIPYSNYWQAGMRRPGYGPPVDRERSAGADFERLFSEDDTSFRVAERGRDGGDYGIMGRLEGLISDDELVPHGRKTTRFEDVPSDSLAVNSMGSFQLSEVRSGAMAMTLFADQGEAEVALDPTPEDLVFGAAEEKGLDRFLGGIGLKAPPVERRRWVAAGRDGRLRRTGLSGSQRRVRFGPTPPQVSRDEFEFIKLRIGEHFHEKFTYSLFLRGTNQNEPITEFLEETKSGHCEFFAGATAILLRRMGIPCRYVVGFAVHEKGGDNEWILRGQHAHAWVEAYVGGRWQNEGTKEDPLWRCRGGEWVDVDLTPPDWTSQGVSHSWTQWFSDQFQSLRANLSLWSSASGLETALTVVLIITSVLLVVYLVRRLLESRGGGLTRNGSPWAKRESALLRDFERWLAKRVGRRPAATPMGSWLRLHLGSEGEGLVELYERSTYRLEESNVSEIREKVGKVKLELKKRQKNPGA